MRRRRKPQPPERIPPLPANASLPPLEILEQFTHASLRQWLEAGKNLESLSHSLFFELERHRAEHSRDLIRAVQAGLSGKFEFRSWARIVDYQFSHQPLSMAGSVARDGGRFNIGGSLNPAAYTKFPALYLAEDFETAYRERFGIERNSKSGGLTDEELTLRRPGSFAHIALRGSVESLFDISDLSVLKPIAAILATFTLPKAVIPKARALRMRPPGLVRTATGLQQQLLQPNWRVQPVQYDLPANSQIFGRLCAAAGAHGILYPSVKNSSMRCLALFPQNWKGGDSFVEIEGPTPPEASTARLDGESSLESV